MPQVQQKRSEIAILICIRHVVGDSIFSSLRSDRFHDQAIFSTSLLKLHAESDRRTVWQG